MVTEVVCTVQEKTWEMTDLMSLKPPSDPSTYLTFAFPNPSPLLSHLIYAKASAIPFSFGANQNYTVMSKINGYHTAAQSTANTLPPYFLKTEAR